MIIVMKPDATPAQVEHVIEKIKELGLKPNVSKGVERTVIGVIGVDDRARVEPLEVYPGVDSVTPIGRSYKLVSRRFHPDNSVILVGPNTAVGGEKIVVMAGPCSVESREQLKAVGDAVKKAGAAFLRGGAFKPRTSPYSFQGLGEEGLKYLREQGDACGLPVVTEVMDTRQVELVVQYADMLQVGARNMQNFDLLREVGQAKKPILLKRGLSSTIEELLLSAEYIASKGNMKIVLCERGIRTFETATRNTMDLSAIPVLKVETHLPVIADPSHGTGSWTYVLPMARAAVAAGADGIMIEVHHAPETAKSDGPQSLKPAKFEMLMKEIRAVAEAIGRSV
ncbi:MAG: 3-deoxy-7-phosphoheptulonate synthase [Candidatus Omnitrophica bacterium]|nr:3-deoxy-7-phosphoheptulonate synthase [Candidatus Omnitrophota bacterium]